MFSVLCISCVYLFGFDLIMKFISDMFLIIVIVIVEGNLDFVILEVYECLLNYRI